MMTFEKIDLSQRSRDLYSIIFSQFRCRFFSIFGPSDLLLHLLCSNIFSSHNRLVWTGPSDKSSG